MTPRPLDLEVLRKDRPQAVFSVNADLDDIGRLERYLRDWLVQNKWGRGLWPQFELAVRKRGEWKIQRKVRLLWQATGSSGTARCVPGRTWHAPTG